MTALELSRLLFTKKVEYERKYPETRQGGRPGGRRGKVAMTTPSFAAVEASSRGISVRSVMGYCRIGKLLSPAAAALVRRTPLANSRRALAALSSVPEIEQPALARRLMGADQRRRDVVYFVRAATGHIKIGRSADPELRLRDLQLGSPVRLVLVGTIATSPEDTEARLHHRFSAAREHGEWFRPVPELLTFIQSLGGSR